MHNYNLLVAVSLMSGALLSTFVHAQEYRYEFTINYDGVLTSKRGIVQPSSTGPDVGAQWIRDRVANSGRPGATTSQMNLFRDAALEFFSTRFGVKPTEPFLPDFNESIMVSHDSMIVPMVMDESSQGHVSTMRRNTDTRYLELATAQLGGYYLLVGESGLSAGGTYKLPLEPGMSSGFGQIIVNNVCPVARQLIVFACTGKGGLDGNLRINFQNDIPVLPMLDQGWNQAEGKPAQMYAEMLTLTQTQGTDKNVEWGDGSCSGIFYAAPRADGNFNLLSSLVCNFGASSNYNGFI